MPSSRGGRVIFTVKVYRSGVLSTYGCDRYDVDTESPRQLALFTRGTGWETVPLEARDEVYIENLAGRTVHAIRPPRES